MRPALIFDTSATFNFGHRDDLTPLLRWLAETHDLLIPPQVQDELRPEVRYDYTAPCAQHFQMRTPRPPQQVADVLLGLRPPLGGGELAVLALTAELAPRATAVVDERRARRCAIDLKLPVIGTLGLMKRAVDARRLSDAEALTCAISLHTSKFSIPDPIRFSSFEAYLHAMQ